MIKPKNNHRDGIASFSMEPTNPAPASFWNMGMRRRDIFSSLLSLFGATFGIGSLGLASAMAQVGIIGWIVLYLLAIFVNFITFESLIHFADKLGLVNYIDISNIVGGQKTRTVLLSLFFITNFGILLSAAVVYNDLICSIVSELGATSVYFTSNLSLFWLVTPGLVLVPILIKRKLKDLAILTLVSLASAFYMVFFLFVSLVWINDAPVERKTVPAILNILNSPGTFAYLLFTLLCQPNVMNIYNELSVKTVPNMRKILIIHLVFMSFIYVSMSAFGYSLFYDKPGVEKKDILALFAGQKNSLLMLANLLMTISALNSFIFSFKPLKDTMIQLLRPKSSDSLETAMSEEENSNCEESDLDPLNVSVTLCLLSFMMVISGSLVLNGIEFLDIIDLLCNIVVPVLFIFLPIYAYLKQGKNTWALAAFSIAAFLYLLKMGEYSWSLGGKLFG